MADPVALSVARAGGRNLALQALRGVAAGSVVIYHAAHYTAAWVDVPWLEAVFNGRFGYYGVLTFFVLSGFLMEGAVRRYDAGTFLAHRLVRLFPTYWTIFLALYLVQAIRQGGFEAIPWQALTLLPLGQMYRPLGVEWTLLYELFFYAMCTLFCFRKAGYTWFLLGWLALIAYTAGFRHQYGTVMQPTLVQIPFSLWNVGFICGGLAGSINRSWRRLPASTLLGLAAFGLVLLGFLSNNALRMFLDSVGVACLILALVRRQPDAVRSPGIFFGMLVLIGEYSYAMYLAHALSIQIALQYVSHAASPLTVFAGMLGVGLVVGITFGAMDVCLYRKLKAGLDSALGRIRALYMKSSE